MSSPLIFFPKLSLVKSFFIEPNNENNTTKAGEAKYDALMFG